MLDLLPQNWLFPAIAFAVSVIGSFLGLSFAARARRAKGLVRWQWLAPAALALGGVAVWSMHFIAIMGFSIPGVSIRYDTPLTVVSGIIAVALMAAALAVTIVRRSLPWLMGGGVIAGAGIIAMHYAGIHAMNVHGRIHHDPLYVALACAVALVAATTALWCASRLRGLRAISAASVVMAVTATSMHYTGMVGVRVEEPSFPSLGTPDGATAADLALPLIVGLFVFMLICSLFLLLGEEEERPSYARRAAHAAPPGSENGRVTASPDYVPRHAGAAPLTTTDTDDVWRPRR